MRLAQAQALACSALREVVESEPSDSDISDDSDGYEGSEISAEVPCAAPADPPSNAATPRAGSPAPPTDNADIEVRPRPIVLTKVEFSTTCTIHGSLSTRRCMFCIRNSIYDILKHHANV